MFTFEFVNLDSLSQLYSEWRETSKLVNFQDFCQGLFMPFWSKFENDSNFLILYHSSKNQNHVYIRIWSFWLTLTILQWMKTNFKLSQVLRFLLRTEYPIQVKIWKSLKLLNSVPFIKKTLVNQLYIRIWSFWLTFTVLQWMKKNSKISQFSSFLLRSGFPI